MDEIFENIKRKPIKFEGAEWRQISAEAKELIKSMLNKNFEDRPTAE